MKNMYKHSKIYSKLWCDIGDTMLRLNVAFEIFKNCNHILIFNILKIVVPTRSSGKMSKLLFCRNVSRCLSISQ